MRGRLTIDRCAATLGGEFRGNIDIAVRFDGTVAAPERGFTLRTDQEDEALQVLGWRETDMRVELTFTSEAIHAHDTLPEEVELFFEGESVGKAAPELIQSLPLGDEHFEDPERLLGDGPRRDVIAIGGGRGRVFVGVIAVTVLLAVLCLVIFHDSFGVGAAVLCSLIALGAYALSRTRDTRTTVDGRAKEIRVETGRYRGASFEVDDTQRDGFDAFAHVRVHDFAQDDHDGTTRIRWMVAAEGPVNWMDDAGYVHHPELMRRLEEWDDRDDARAFAAEVALVIGVRVLDTTDPLVMR